MSALAALAQMSAPDPLSSGFDAMRRRDFPGAAATFHARAVADHGDIEARYWLYSALVAGGAGGPAAEGVLEEARALHAVAVLRQAGVDMARFGADKAYCAQVGATCYANHLMGPASVALGRALDFEAIDARILLQYGLSLQHQGRMREATEVFTAAADICGTPEVHQFLIYALFHAPDRLARVSAEARRWSQLHAEGAGSAPVTFANNRSTTRRLRIGYFAPSLTRSQVATSTVAVLEAHDPAAVTVFAYCNDPAAEMPLPRHCTVRKLGGLSDQDAAALIRRDKVDVLVDCWGHTAGSRLRMFSLRPAPVQAGWINFMQTTGLEAMDYVLHADSMAVPGTEAFFSEAIWRTGPIMAPYRPTAQAAEATPTPARANGFVTFGSFNNPAKLSDATLAAWGRILAARPGDRLLLKYRYFTDPVLQRVTQARLAAQGADPEQVIFAGHSAGADYAAAFADVDLALDPSPCPGGTTTLDAIANGVPVLALKGDDFYARTCLPLLLPCGLGELVAESWDDYVAKALALTADVDALDALRARVRPGFETSAYRDEAGFTRRLEADYRKMFTRWVETTA